MEQGKWGRLAGFFHRDDLAMTLSINPSGNSIFVDRAQQLLNIELRDAHLLSTGEPVSSLVLELRNSWHHKTKIQITRLDRFYEQISLFRILRQENHTAKGNVLSVYTVYSHFVVHCP